MQPSENGSEKETMEFILVDGLGKTNPRFLLPETEHAFRQHTLEEDKKRMGMVLLMGILSYICFHFFNYYSLGPGMVFFKITLARAIFVLCCAAVFVYLPTVRNEKDFDAVLMGVGIILVACNAYVTGFQASGAVSAAVSDLLLVLSIYLLVPINLGYKALTCALISLVSPSLWGLFPFFNYFNLVTYHLFCHGIGLVFNAILQKNRRVQFRQLMEDRELKKYRIEAELKFGRFAGDIQEEYYLFSHDLDGVFTYISPGASGILGDLANNIIGKNWRDVFEPIEGVISHVEEIDKACLQGETPGRFVFPFNHSPKGLLIFEARKIPVMDTSGKVISIEGFAKDITEKTKNRQTLDFWKNNCSHILDNLGLGITVVQEGRLRFVNRDFLEWTKTTQEEIIKKTEACFFLADEDKTNMVATMTRLLSGQTDKITKKYRSSMKVTSPGWIICTSVSISWEDRPAVLNILQVQPAEQ